MSDEGAGSMADVRFGMFDWIDRRQAPLGQIYEQRLQLIEAGETAGFYCYHLAEHHATPLGMAPSPALFLAAAAQRTHTIRLGPLVYLLPLYEPLRLIEIAGLRVGGARGEREQQGRDYVLHSSGSTLTRAAP